MLNPDVVQEAPERSLGGVEILAVDEAHAVELCLDALEAPGLTMLAFANAHCINVAAGNERYRRCLSRFIVLPDGIGVDIGSKLLYGAPFPANLNGTDFVPKLLRASARPLTVALLGGKPGIAERAAERLAGQAPQHRFLAVSSGFFAKGAETEGVLDALADAQADIVLVALGVPRQELFIAENLNAGHARLAIGVGALLDFLAGRVPRAPVWMRRARVEWVYRLGIEPGRLARRYLLGNPRFLATMLLERLRRTR